MKPTNKNQRISIRLSANQMQILDELKNALGTTYSILIRAIVLDFLTRNDDSLEKIIQSKIKQDYDIQGDCGEELQ